MGIGDSWGTREELLHPRDKNGRFRSKWKMASGVVNAILKALSSFSPRTFSSDGEAGQYLFNHAKPSRFRGGSDFKALTGFAQANKNLRAGSMDAETKKFVQVMDESSVNLPEDVILSKVVGPQAFGLTPETVGLDDGGIEDFTGKLIGDRGYNSAMIGTPGRKQPGQIEMRIAVPKGTKAVIPATSRGDREVILDKDQELRVTKVTPDGQGGYYVLAVAQPRTPGDTPEPVGSPAPAPGAPQAPGVPGDVQSDNAPNPRAMVQQPGAPPPRSEPEVTPSIGGGPVEGVQPAPGVPGQGVPEAPAPSAPGAPAVDAPAPAVPRIVDLRAAVREAQLPVPSRGKRRRDWDQAYYKLASPKPANPDDVLRELDKDIEVHRREMADLAEGGDSDPLLADDVEALEGLRDLIREKYDRPAPERAPEPAPAKKAAPAKVAPVKKAAPAAPRTQAGLPKLERPPPPVKKAAPERAPGARGTTTDGRRQAALEAAKASPITGTEGNSYRNIVKGLEGGDLTPAAAAKQARDSAAYFRKSATTAGNFSRPNETGRDVERRKATVDRINALADRYENLSVSIKEAGRHAASGPGGRLKSELLTEARQRGIDVRPSWTKDRIGAALRGEAPAPAKKAAPVKEAAPEAPAAPGDDLDKMTRNELLQEARKRRLTGYSSKTKDQLKQMIRESGADDRGLRQVDVPDADAVQQMRKIPKSQITAGDLAVWQPPGEEAVVGRVVQVGSRKTFVDWAGGRRENIAAAKGSPNITFHREGAAPAPVKKAAPETGSVTEARAVEIENRIRAAYRDELTRRGGSPGNSSFVGLADIREALGEDYPRPEVDRVLRSMAQRSGDPNSPDAVRLISTANSKALKQRDLDAAIPMRGASQGPQVGGLHSIAMADPSPRPLPGAALTAPAKAAKAAVPGAAPGTAAGKITAARLQPGTRILVAAESNGRWLPTNRKTDSLSVEVVRVDRVQGGTTPGGRGTSRARIRVTTRDELGRETATNVSPSQTLLVHEHAPGTPAARAAETKVDGPKATTPVLAPDRKKSLHDAVADLELNFETGSAKRQVDEIVDDMEAGKLTPEEGIRRLETEIALNKEELADLDRAVREEGNQELKRLGVEKQRKLAGSIKEQERASAGLRKHFGKEPAVTTDEVVINLTPEQGDALNKATLADLKKAAEGLGIKVTGRTKKQFLDALLKKMAEKELERRGLLEKAPAPKAADGPAKDLPAAKWERVNVSALAEGLGLDTRAAQERIERLQKEFDDEKLTPKKIAEELRHRARMVSWGGVVEKQVGIKDDNDPDRNEAARVKGDKLLGEGRKLLELADRIEKVRRRRPSNKPEPEKPKLSVPEKAEIKQVAELTDIPAEALAKKALAKKKADAPPPRTAQQVVDTLLVANSDEESNAILKGHTKAELLDIAKAVFVRVKPGDSKQKIIDTILGAGALHRAPPDEAPAPSGGALTRAQLQEMTVPEIKALEDELEIQRPSLNRDDRIDAILKAQGAAPAPKAAAAPDPEEAARKRQADIDQARKIGNVAGEWSEILGLNASPEAMLARLRVAEAREGVDLSRIIQSVENGDMRQAAVRIETMIDNANLVRRGTAGRIQQYHAASDQLMPGETVGPSGRVRVLRPGYTLKRDGEQILLSRPIVVPLDDDEVDVPAPDVDRPKKGLHPGATRATDIKVPAGFDAWYRDGRKKSIVIYDKDLNPVATVSPISVKVDAEEGDGQEDVQERFYGSLWGQPGTNTGSIRSQADAVKAALDMMKRDQPSKLSTKPILENTWGGRRSEIHFHADGAIGMGLSGLKEDDRRLEVNGDALENVIGRIATDLVTGQITGDEQIDRLRDIAAGLPDGPAKRAVSRMVIDLDAPRREAIKVPDAGQYTGVLQELMNKLLQIPLARGGSRADRQDFNEVDLLLDYIKSLRPTRPPSVLEGDLRRALHNKRHESMEGKLAIDRAIEDAMNKMRAMKRQPS